MTAEIGSMIFLWLISISYWVLFYKEYQELMDEWFSQETNTEELHDPQESPLVKEC